MKKRNSIYIVAVFVVGIFVGYEGHALLYKRNITEEMDRARRLNNEASALIRCVHELYPQCKPDSTE